MLSQLITPASLLAGLIERLRSGKSSIHSNAHGSVGSSLVSTTLILDTAFLSVVLPSPSGEGS
jgi:hypothetical protein